MERLIKRHIFNFLVRNHILSEQQFGFVPGRSGHLKIGQQNWNSGNEADIIYIDFQKAFDSVPHKRLLRVIECFGILGKTLD